ncbi:hypothetical protein EON65_39035 [archaeon]|nr:MAG: hypothetical protein EON65_39035 [archaeon]
MNRANQIALFQATNQGLLNIRQAELNYYINLNIAFGTQAALIGGFTYGVFTQNQKNEDYDYAYIFQDIYWITSAGTIAASVHVIITTMLLQVLGPGLALHGPVGSVANAADGLRREQKTVITAFILMMILFSFSTVLSFWAVMSQVWEYIDEYVFSCVFLNAAFITNIDIATQKLIFIHTHIHTVPYTYLRCVNHAEHCY